LAGLVLVTAIFIGWIALGGGVWRGKVSVIEAELRSSNVLVLVVASCGGDPEVTQILESDRDVLVEIVASSTPLAGGDDCLDLVEVQLQQPLEDRVVIDGHSGQTVDVSVVVPTQSSG